MSLRTDAIVPVNRNPRCLVFFLTDEASMDYVDIQAQDSSGNWRTYSRTQNNAQMILIRMKELQRQFPTFRIRAVDGNGRVVDIL